MAPNDTTLLEPPVTPAPLFAYRALRGFIFGSPDPNESPEREAQIAQKENILPTRLGSPSKEHATRLSPTKRKRGSDALAPPISPTKGILRTPGLLTPRAKALRDVNVKFRSVSPEMRRKDTKRDSGVSAAPAPAATAPTVIKSKDEPRKKINTKTADDRATSTACKDDSQKQSTTSTTTAPPSAFDDYQRRTERQMKILIAERNKWRDMARKSGDENTRLKLQLTQVERENERLQTRLDALETTSESHVAARTGLAPDRYSAARARLQARQQARKASSSLRLKGGGDEAGKSRQAIEEADESHIDWAGLALG
ncbi:hypothetical protein DV735_g2271, partial [Chaetothyriales sp. CBS 134920]